MLYLNAMVLVKPEVFIAQAATKFDAQGQCTDETTRKFVGEQMAAFERWIAGVGRMRATR
jgi:chromate reductase